MKELPLHCKILRDYDGTANVDTSSFGTLTKDITSINPHSIGDTINAVWGNLSYADIQAIEENLLSSKGTEKFTYNGFVYHLEDSYTITVTNNLPKVSCTLRRIS